MAAWHTNLAIAGAVLLGAVALVFLVRILTAGKEAANKGTKQIKEKSKLKKALSDDDSVEFQNQMYESDSYDMENPAMFDTDKKKKKKKKNFDDDDDDGKKTSRSEKNRERKEKAARRKAREAAAKQAAIDAEVAAEEAKAKAARKKAKAKAKKKAAKGKGARDMSKLTVTKEQFEEELKYTKAMGDTRDISYNHSGIGQLMSNKANAMGAKSSKAKELHKEKSTQRGGASGLL
eukprot:COSAG05_NODE_72_length_21963_cov_153.494535_7_plen_234_part_00